MKEIKQTFPTGLIIENAVGRRVELDSGKRVFSEEQRQANWLSRQQRILENRCNDAWQFRQRHPEEQLDLDMPVQRTR